ncbi:hypothetical protein ACFP3Q_09345 [Nocardioides sp. GCM10027113]|uniref:hypothetical protein n=1 Tax=unclassified Nocardioides TaxID=2615069 RepID=UPI00361B408F
MAALAATADLVVHGRVTSVEAGEPQLLSDGSAETHTPRWLVVEVADKLLVRGTVAEPATSLRVYDGFWSDGVGYRLDAYDWARPGDEGYFFLSRDEAPDGTPLDTYTPLGSEGRVLLGLRTTVYDASDTSVWSTALGSSATAATVRQTVDRAVDRARSGDAKPVLVEVCRPSDPDDESSEPICEME